MIANLNMSEQCRIKAERLSCLPNRNRPLLHSHRIIMTEPTTDLWLDGIKHHPSPNHDARPNAADVSLLVIHNISLPPGEFGGSYIDDFFLNRLNTSAHPYFAQLADLRVSAHCLIRRDGEVIQYVPLNKRAWHAGQSCFDGRDACNDFSIGIELEGTDTLPFTDAQYRQLVALTRQIMTHYPLIRQDRIRGHSDIAPERKTDPGPAFDWLAYRTMLDSALA